MSKKPGRAVEALIRKMQKREDAERAKRRRRLRNALSRALLYLSDADMTVIEPVLHEAIGRSIVMR